MLSFRIFSLCLALALAATGRASPEAVEAEPVEGAPILFAKDLLDAALLKGPRYQVLPVVDVENFAYVFEIESDFGRFQALGIDGVKVCIREVEAIEKLNQFNQTEAFAKTLTDRLRDPVSVTVGIARRPFSTVAGLPVGIGRYLQGKVYQIQKGSEKAWSTVSAWDDPKEDEKPKADEEDPAKSKSAKVIDSTGKLSRKYLGYDDAKRGWAKRLGVDPYSDNEALQQALGRISWASSLGAFAGDFAVPSSEVMSYANKAQEISWDRSPIQIEQANRKTLKKIGVPKELIREFIDSGGYSLTEKTAIVLSIQEMEETKDWEPALALILLAVTKDEALGFTKTFQILETYDRQVSPIQTVEIRDGLIAATARNGYLVVPLAVDYLHWTPLIATPLLSEEFAAERRELWVSGCVSPIAKERLRASGWHVFDMCLDSVRSPVTNAFRLDPDSPGAHGSPRSARAASK